MQITSLVIQPEHSWQVPSNENPLRAVVKLNNKNSTVETVIPHDMMQPLLDLVSGIVSKAAQQNVAEFVASVSAIQSDAGTTKIEDMS